MVAFGSVVGGVGDTSPAARFPAPTSPPRPVVQPFQQGVHLFLADVAQGMPASEALLLFAKFGNGQFSHDDRCFFPTNEVLGPVPDRIGLLHRTERKVICGCEGEADTTLLLVASDLAGRSQGSVGDGAGTLDAVTRSITRGQLVMPRIAAPSQQTALRNHPSWEKDKDAKRALGPVIAKWLATGVLE